MMFDTFRRSWNLVKISWEILQQDRELLTFPFVSMLGGFVITIIYGIIAFVVLSAVGAFSTDEPTTFHSIVGFILLFLYYFCIYSVFTYANVALTGAVFIRFRGGDPTLKDGTDIANSMMPAILGFAAINATVGVILSMIRSNARESNNLVFQILGSLLAGILEFAWDVATFLAIPSMVDEKLNAIDSIKRSSQLVGSTWGRQLAGVAGMGFVFGLIITAIILIGFVLVLGTISLNSGLLTGLVVVVTLIAVIGVSLISGALTSIYRVALYFYANEKKVEYYDEAILQDAFRLKPA
ncbi:MAG: DUF6159 family protein [Anaerolineae bacterium]|nr:DUF6159 family protein [Anaerolineae bacterium]